MQIKVDNPYGLTGSESINGLYVYVSENKFTVDNLPTPYMNNTPSYSGYTVYFPEKDKPYWLMWAYRGKDNQKVYSPCVRLVDWSSTMSTVFNGRPAIFYGNASAGALGNSVRTADAINLKSFDLDGTDNIPWENTNRLIEWCMLEGIIYGVTSTASLSDVTPETLYKKGYLGKSGDMSDIYSETTITQLGGPVVQGKSVNRSLVKYQTWVPTLDEFKTILGTIFQTDIPSDYPPITPMVIAEDIWIITSTESSPGNVFAINSLGQTKELPVNSAASVYMLIKMEKL